MNDEGIAKFMRNLLSRYDEIRGEDKNSGYLPFWDAVVITTKDEEQKQAYQEQLKVKASRKELPLHLDICVVADPAGPKLGNGGSTFTALSHLEKIHGEKLYGLKVLLIHAGGLSQRLPSASVLGKIFSLIPRGNPCYQMLDIKLALFWPFVPKMKSGVFVTCADDIIVYDLGDESGWSVAKEGFVALAHPSSLRIGTGHGVFLLEDPELCNDAVKVCGCLEVMQKPSEEKMKLKGACVRTKGLLGGEPFVYTDSAFLFSSEVTRKLLRFMKESGPLECEVDAYGDFLQALGIQASPDYIHVTKNVAAASQELIPTRKKIFQLLRGTDLNVLVLNHSRFIHIGTMNELLFNFCENKSLRQDLQLSHDAFSCWTTDSANRKSTTKKRKSIMNGCVMYSMLPKGSFISDLSVLEFCDFRGKVIVPDNCIVSNCECQQDELIAFPKNVFLHTIPLSCNNETKYATVVFHVNDNIKKCVSQNDIGDLSYLAVPLRDILPLWNVSVEQISHEDNCNEVNLWVVNLFPISDTMTDSLKLALNLVQSVQSGEKIDLQSHKLVSMATILKLKSIEEMLKYRNGLHEKILTN